MNGNNPSNSSVGIQPNGLPLPRSFEARYGSGARKALVLGGGGPFIIAWQLGYLRGMHERGVDVTHADLVVGTSGGSVVASLVARGKAWGAAAHLSRLSHLPPMLLKSLAPQGLSSAQKHALALFVEATDADPETVLAIGRAALASPVRAAPRLLGELGASIAGKGWPSKGLKVTTVDAQTGERLVIDVSAGVDVGRAVAASCAVPGMFPLQNIKGRRCMDGGVAGSSTHCDVVAGADKALVLAIDAQAPFLAAAMTTPVGALNRELNQLAATGTQIMARGPLAFTVEQLLAVDSMPAAFKMGFRQAATDADQLRDFWNRLTAG